MAEDNAKQPDVEDQPAEQAPETPETAPEAAEAAPEAGEAAPEAPAEQA